jgi:hypothetical protein
MLDWSKPLFTKHSPPKPADLIAERTASGRRKCRIPQYWPPRGNSDETFCYNYDEQGRTRGDLAHSEYDLQNGEA